MVEEVDRRLVRNGPMRGGTFGRGGPSGRGFFGNQPDVALAARFDRDKNGVLDPVERRAALAEAESLARSGGRPRRGGSGYAPEPGRPLSPDDVRPYPTTDLYDAGTLRTLFLTFENQDWERELMAFKTTDVDVPATLVVDGRTYQNVGVQFHGNSSFNSVPAGFKHSMRLALDLVDESQDLKGYNTLLLLNAHEDPSFLRTVLAMQIARDYGPAPKANFVRVVINGESWGVYVNQQHFNKDLLRDAFETTTGARWKVPGNPGGRGGGLAYLGNDLAAYKRTYEIKSKDEADSWAGLMRMTRLLENTLPERLESVLAPYLDIDEALRYLAVDNALVNADGYWTRGSDYSLYMDGNGQFHVLPYDVNSTFSAGRGRGGRGASPNLDPMQASLDPRKPLASKLLAVPALRDRYLGYVRDIATKWLDWRRLGRIVAGYHALIDADVRADTRKLESYDAFQASVAGLKDFAAARREFLLSNR
jgi:hypothetical protein